MYKGGILLSLWKNKLLKRLRSKKRRKRSRNKIRDCWWWNGNVVFVRSSIPWETLTVRCVGLRCLLRLLLSKFTKKFRPQMWVRLKTGSKSSKEKDSKRLSNKLANSSKLIGKIRSKKYKKRTKNWKNLETNLSSRKKIKEKKTCNPNHYHKNLICLYLQDQTSSMMESSKVS